MIQFKCICGEPFEVPAELAGDQFQCPACKRLVDVPMLGDTDSLNEDGTIKMEDSSPIEPALAEKMRAFSYRSDMRQSIEEFLALDDAAPADEAPVKLPPKYDPETGELIEQIDVDGPQAIPVESIPMARPTLAYARKEVAGGKSEHEFSWWQAPFYFLTGGNIISMIVILIVQIGCHLVLMVPALNLFISPIILMTSLAIVAHYCNVIEEFGPYRNDTIPVMMRHASIGEDLWWPMLHFFYSMFLAFGPMYLAQLLRFNGVHIHSMFIEGLFYFGFLVFPAILLASVTSGTVLNTFPHRILPVILCNPLRYLIVAGLMFLGYKAYGLVIGIALYQAFGVLNLTSGMPDINGFVKVVGVLYTLMIIATYVCHLAAGMLGLIYRDYYPKFNWVLQDYIKSTRNDTIAQLERMRRSGDPRLRSKRATPVLPVQPLPTQSSPPRR